MLAESFWLTNQTNKLLHPKPDELQHGHRLAYEALGATYVTAFVVYCDLWVGAKGSSHNDVLCGIIVNIFRSDYLLRCFALFNPTLERGHHVMIRVTVAASLSERMRAGATTTVTDAWR
jgi:hypothetical protein